MDTGHLPTFVMEMQEKQNIGSVVKQCYLLSLPPYSPACYRHHFSMAEAGSELRRRAIRSEDAKVQFQPLPASYSSVSSSNVTKCQPGRGRSGRIGLQLPANYILKGQGNAFWNKKFSTKVSLDRRCRERKRLSQAPDPWLQHRQQQQLLMQQQQMMLMQAQRGSYDDDVSDDSSVCRRKVKSGMRQNAKAIFAFLMLPSLIMIFNSHKKISKEESNVDISALRAGGFGGMGGMAGMGGGGGGGAGGGIPGLPGSAMGRGLGDHEVPGVMPGRHPAMRERESADEYTRRLMSHYGQRGERHRGHRPVSEEMLQDQPEDMDADHDALPGEIRNPFDVGEGEVDDVQSLNEGVDNYDQMADHDSMTSSVYPETPDHGEEEGDIAAGDAAEEIAADG